MAEDKVTTAHLDTVVTMLREGFDGMHSRMDRFEDEVRPVILEQAKQLAVLKDRAERAETAANTATSAVNGSHKTLRNRAAAWGTGAAAVVWGVMKMWEFFRTLN